MHEKQLQKLLVDAVTSRATKQKPSIRQVTYLRALCYNLNIVLYLNLGSFFLMQIKFLQNEKKGKVDTKNYSRGVAFVEFTEHEHALVALRVLNNNPGKYF